MARLLIIHDPADGRSAERLRADLERRGWTVFAGSFGQGFSSVPGWYDGSTRTIALLPDSSTATRHQAAMQSLESAVRLQDRPELILVVDRHTQLPDWTTSPAVYGTIVSDSQPYDRLFEQLFRTLLGPWPGYVDVRVRPTQLQQPTGVAWWSQDLFVADDVFEQVVRVGPDSEAVFIPGLTEPHHVHIDRRKLLVANKGADELILADVAAGMASEVRSLPGTHTPFASPHDACQAMGLTAVADTDHHAVYFTHDDLWRTAKPQWEELVDPTLAFSYPCGVHIDGRRIWVADTFNSRVLWFDHAGQVLGQCASDPFHFPVCVRSWRNLVFISDEDSKRLLAYRLFTDDSSERLELVDDAVGGPWVRSPFGLSINRENRLAVVDRDRACVWLLDLEAMFPDSLD